MEKFRLLDIPPMSAAENMALDEALLELKGRERTPNTIRFLQFNPPAALVGYHQSVEEEIREEYCHRHGIDINRRITGGGAIFFDQSQLGWEIICDKQFFDMQVVTDKLFRILCAPMITALAEFGITAVFRPRNDIEINGRKISGTGGTESEGAFLFQGSLLVDFDADTMLQCLRIPVEKLKAKEIDSIKHRVTCLKWELGNAPDLGKIKQAIIKSFEKHLNIQACPDELTWPEKRLLEEKLPYFLSSKWINAVQPKDHGHETLRAACRSDAGLVQYTLAADYLRKRIKHIYITGDFLSFPSRAIYDLESDLRGGPLERERVVEKITQFFEKGHIRIPGMSVGDFIRPLDQIFQKIALFESGNSMAFCG